MENSRFTSKGSRFAVAYVCVLLATALALLIFSPTQASQEPVFTGQPMISSSASLSSSPVITIGVGSWLSAPPAYTAIFWGPVNSVQLAVNQTNAAGGISVGGVTYTLALVTADDGCSATQVVTAANTLLNAGAVAVVGYGCSAASSAAEPIHNAAGVAMISPVSTQPSVTQQGYNIVFRTVYHDGTPPAMLATHFREWLRFSKSAIVEQSGSTQYGDYYQNTFTALGGTITSRRTIADSSLFTSTLAAIQPENPDAIVNLFATDGSTGGSFSKIAYNQGMPNVVIGWSSFTNDEAVLTSYANAAGTVATEGDYVAMEGRRTQDMPGYSAYLAAYQAAGFPNSTTDPGPYGPYGYDAARIIIDAISRAGSTNPFAIRNAIAATQNHQGVVGTYQGFDSHGDVIPQWVWLERYQNGQWAILNPSQLFLPLVLR